MGGYHTSPAPRFSLPLPQLRVDCKEIGGVFDQFRAKHGKELLEEFFQGLYLLLLILFVFLASLMCNPNLGNFVNPRLV